MRQSHLPASPPRWSAQSVASQHLRAGKVEGLGDELRLPAREVSAGGTRGGRRHGQRSGGGSDAGETPRSRTSVAALRTIRSRDGCSPLPCFRGVSCPASMRAVYPRAMTVVIGFATVRRSFDDSRHRSLFQPDSAPQRSAPMNTAAYLPISPLFRVCDGVRIRFADNNADSSEGTVLMLSPWPESLGPSEGSGTECRGRLAWSRSTCRASATQTLARS